MNYKSHVQSAAPNPLFLAKQLYSAKQQEHQMVECSRARLGITATDDSAIKICGRVETPWGGFRRPRARGSGMFGQESAQRWKQFEKFEAAKGRLLALLQFFIPYLSHITPSNLSQSLKILLSIVLTYSRPQMKGSFVSLVWVGLHTRYPNQLQMAN